MPKFFLPLKTGEEFLKAIDVSHRRIRYIHLTEHMSHYEKQSQVCVKYIGIAYHNNNLHRKKMLAKAIANNFKLSPIPSELSDLTDIEKRFDKSLHNFYEDNE